MPNDITPLSVSRRQQISQQFLIGYILTRRYAAVASSATASTTHGYTEQSPAATATSYDSTLVSTVMFHCVNEVYGDLLVTFQRASGRLMAAIIEDIIFFELGCLKAFRICSLCITILPIDFHSLGMVSQHLVAIHVYGDRAERPKLGLIDHT